MNCEEIKEILYDYFKNEVSTSEISEIETHLKACDSCGSELAHLKGISSLLKASMEEPHNSVFLNISRNIKPAAGKTVAWFKPALAAALVMLMATGFYILSFPKKTEVAEVPKEVAAGYAVLENNILEEENPAEEPVTSDEASFGASSYGNGNYTPVSYIVGQDEF